MIKNKQIQYLCKYINNIDKNKIICKCKVYKDKENVYFIFEFIAIIIPIDECPFNIDCEKYWDRNTNDNLIYMFSDDVTQYIQLTITGYTREYKILSNKLKLIELEDIKNKKYYVNYELFKNFDYEDTNYYIKDGILKILKANKLLGLMTSFKAKS